jgi:hypothetical protein
MNDAAVVARLMARELGFFFKQEQSQIGMSTTDLQSRGEPNDSAADDREVVLGGHSE